MPAIFVGLAHAATKGAPGGRSAGMASANALKVAALIVKEAGEDVDKPPFPKGDVGGELHAGL